MGQRVYSIIRDVYSRSSKFKYDYVIIAASASDWTLPPESVRADYSRFPSSLSHGCRGNSFSAMIGTCPHFRYSGLTPNRLEKRK